jgi:SAM-dependent methyltransferase
MKMLHNFVIYHIADNALRERASKYFKGRLIDIGCGTKPYRGMLSPFVDEHVGIDFEDGFYDAANVDLIGTAYNIPAENGEYDCALSSAVLEHLEEPEESLKECARVLKTGGYAIYTVPFIWHVHGKPRDFYRFTNFGLQYLFEKSGFEVVEIKALSGFWVTVGQMFVNYLQRFHRGPMRYLPIIPMLQVPIQLITFGLHKIDKSDIWTWMYIVVARKK